MPAEALQPADKARLFDVEIPVAGRYRVEVSATGNAMLNVEDYIHNKDGRNYDITADMPRQVALVHVVLAKDGSPLNAGLHNMKLHIRDGEASSRLDQVHHCIKEHELTPYTLQQNVDGDEWVLVWSDEFEPMALPTPKSWAYDIGNWGWGNREPQYYTANRLENARCENGYLDHRGPQGPRERRLVSARLTTRGRMSLLYGKIEFRAKATPGDGTWAAIWLLGDAYRDEVSWPYCGEVDILENVGREIDDRPAMAQPLFLPHACLLLQARQPDLGQRHVKTVGVASFMTTLSSGRPRR